MVDHMKSIEELRWDDYQLHDKGVGEALDGGMRQNKRCKWCLDSDSDDDNDNAELEEYIVRKRRKFVDEMVPNLFQEVHLWKKLLFDKWWSSTRHNQRELKLCGYTISNPTTFFREAYNKKMWLDTDHVDIAMLLLRKRQVKYPISFGRFNCAILDSNFHELLKLGTIDAMEEYVDGKVFKHGKKWKGCTHLYYPVCTRKHWVAVEVVFIESAMYVYDCDDKVISTSDLEDDLHIASVLIPKLAKFADISTKNTLKIVRVDGLPRQPVPGDCGVYTIKYIEFLSIQEPADLVDDSYMKMWREKLTIDLFTQNFDP